MRQLSYQRQVRNKGLVWPANGKAIAAKFTLDAGDERQQGLQGIAAACPEQSVVPPIAETVHTQFEGRRCNLFQHLNQAGQTLVRHLSNEGQGQMNGLPPRGTTTEATGRVIGQTGKSGSLISRWPKGNKYAGHGKSSF